MATFIALLRAINVGGTGKLAMADLVRLCERCGLSNVRTYIQSGNVVLSSEASESEVKAMLDRALLAELGRPVGVLVRRAEDIERVLAANPFKEAQPSRVIVMFLDEAPPEDAMESLVPPGREEIKLNGREIFIHYPDGQGRSRLKVPFADVGTGRNINTLGKLAAMARTIMQAAGDL